MILNNFTKRNLGFSLIETLFYVSLLVILSIVVTNSMIVMMKSFKETTILTQISDSSSIVEKISREIRQANDINSISANDLILKTKDINDIDKTVEFSLVGSNLQIIENGSLTGNLNNPNIVVTALNFTQIVTAQGKAIKLTLSVRSILDQLNRTYDFYDTVALRGSY